MNTIFVDVILPLSLPNTYTYRVPRELNDQITVGKRVVVQFGKSKMYSALVKQLHHKAPIEYEAKYIDEILDDAPIVTQTQFEFWDWVANYYMCFPGDVMNAALPGGFKLNSETKLVWIDTSEKDLNSLTDQEYLVHEALENNEVLTLQDVSNILGKKTVYPIIKSLLKKEFIALHEELQEKYKPRMVSFIQLHNQYKNEKNLRKLFDELSKAPKQLELLMKYVELSRILSDSPKPVKKVLLQKAAQASSAQVNTLVKKRIFSIHDKEEGRLAEYELETQQAHELSDAQQQAFEQINSEFEQKDICLLHGVTGSGKTEVYVKLIADAISKGKQVLYLLPEIALTTQIINRLQRFFGNKIGVYHSKFNQNERVEVWQNLLLKKQYDIVLGARSSLFLPFTDLGLIIIDEEHESTFKQYEPAPRYNARDAATVLAKRHGAKVLLGSATPSVETYINAHEKRFGLVELTKRFSGVQLPEIFVADLKNATKKREMKGHFSPLLIKSMEEAFENDEQVILFQNRRGFSPFIQCETCGWTPQCKRCDVGLTYHKYQHRLKCHYCGYEAHMPKTCSACGSTEVKLKGFGTEKIEDDLQIMFPNIRVARMDLDTTRAKHAYQRIINDFEDRQIDVLVGTQMVTKGLDFDNVSLVGIMNADFMLNFQDFRAHEKSYQLMSQVAGRAGRKEKRGKVIIQSFDPYHPIIRNVIQHEYHEMFRQQVLERRNFQYPPFYKMIKFTFKHRDIEKVSQGAHHFAKHMKKIFGPRILGPEFPPIKRIRNLYHMQLILKVEKTRSFKKAREIVMDQWIDFRQHPDFKSVRISIDVDPV